MFKSSTRETGVMKNVNDHATYLANEQVLFLPKTNQSTKEIKMFNKFWVLKERFVILTVFVIFCLSMFGFFIGADQASPNKVYQGKSLFFHFTLID